MNTISPEQTFKAETATAARTWVLGFTSLLFILLQSACTAVIAFSGIGTIVGLGSFAAALGLTRLTGSFHGDLVRIPMMVVALAGSLINLYVLRRTRALRARPSSQWRLRALPEKQKRKEAFLLALSVLTILLVAAEFIAHMALHHSL